VDPASEHQCTHWNLLGNADFLIVCENKLSRIGELDYTAPTAGNTHNNGMSHKRKLDQRNELIRIKGQEDYIDFFYFITL